MVEIEFNLGNYEFGGRIMVGFVSNEVRDQLFVQRILHALIDELIEKLIVICVCICIFDGVEGQALEKDRGKQPETFNQ